MVGEATAVNQAADNGLFSWELETAKRQSVATGTFIFQSRRRGARPRLRPSIRDIAQTWRWELPPLPAAGRGERAGGPAPCARAPGGVQPPGISNSTRSGGWPARRAPGGAARSRRLAACG